MAYSYKIVTYKRGMCVKDFLKSVETQKFLMIKVNSNLLSFI